MSEKVEQKFSEENGSESHHHVVPAGLLVGMFLALLVLTWITVEASRLDLRDFHVHNVYIGLGIAVIQGTLVALFFMGLLWEKPFHRSIILGTLVFAAVFLALCLIDIRDYEATLDPTSPQVQEKLDQGRKSLVDPDF